MTKDKTDEILEKLEESIPEYIKRVGSFQYENETYTLAGHHTSENYLTCEICGHERIIDVYVIQDSHGNRLNVGNVCIRRISNQKIGEWFKHYQLKKENIQRNRLLINDVDEILQDNEDDTLPISISTIGIERLQKMYDRMTNGKQPTETQRKLLSYYVRKIESADE